MSRILHSIYRRIMAVAQRRQESKTFLTELSVVDLRFSGSGVVSSGRRGKASAVALYIHDLLGSRDDEEPIDVDCEDHARALADLLDELKRESEWRQRSARKSKQPERRPQDASPSVMLARLSLSDWARGHSDSLTLDYTLRLWSMGQLETSACVSDFGMSVISGDEQLRRGGLLCAFKEDMAMGLANLTALNRKARERRFRDSPNQLSRTHSPMKGRYRRSTDGRVLTAEDIEVMEEEKDGRRGRLAHAITKGSKLLLSKTLHALRPLRSREETKEREEEHAEDECLRACLLSALKLGQSTGVLAVAFALST